jgi:hypothetical protein
LSIPIEQVVKRRMIIYRATNNPRIASNDELKMDENCKGKKQKNRSYHLKHVLPISIDKKYRVRDDVEMEMI